VVAVTRIIARNTNAVRIVPDVIVIPVHRA
jgi:hypothetical protein